MKIQPREPDLFEAKKTIGLVDRYSMEQISIKQYYLLQGFACY